MCIDESERDGRMRFSNPVVRLPSRLWHRHRNGTRQSRRTNPDNASRRAFRASWPSRELVSADRSPQSLPNPGRRRRPTRRQQQPIVKTSRHHGAAAELSAASDRKSGPSLATYRFRSDSTHLPFCGAPAIQISPGPGAFLCRVAGGSQ